jgi:hypothetical protein
MTSLVFTRDTLNALESRTVVFPIAIGANVADTLDSAIAMLDQIKEWADSVTVKANREYRKTDRTEIDKERCFAPSKAAREIELTAMNNILRAAGLAEWHPES